MADEPDNSINKPRVFPTGPLVPTPPTEHAFTHVREEKPAPAPEPAKNPKRTNFLRNWERQQMQRKMVAKAREGIVWHAVVEWTLVRCLAYAERVICIALAIAFPLDKQHDFLSLSGVEFTVGALVILGPVFGICMFLLIMPVYAMLRSRKKMPKTVAGYRRIVVMTTCLLSPFVIFGTYYIMKAYYDMVGAAPIMEQFKALSNYSFFPKSK